MIEVTSIIFRNADPVTEELEKYQLKYKDKVNVFFNKNLCSTVN